MSLPSVAPDFDSVLRVCADAWWAAIHWCQLLTDTQRLLLPTAALVVTLLWVKMCPIRRNLPSTAREDEALYSAAIERWSAASEADRPGNGLRVVQRRIVPAPHCANTTLW